MLPGNKFRTDGEASCSAPAGVVYEVYLQPGKVVLPGVVKAEILGILLNGSGRGTSSHLPGTSSHLPRKRVRPPQPSPLFFARDGEQFAKFGSRSERVAY